MKEQGRFGARLLSAWGVHLPRLHAQWSKTPGKEVSPMWREGSWDWWAPQPHRHTKKPPDLGVLVQRGEGR